LRIVIDLITIKINGRKTISLKSGPTSHQLATVVDHPGIYGQQSRCWYLAARNCETKGFVLQAAAATLQLEETQRINNPQMC